MSAVDRRDRLVPRQLPPEARTAAAGRVVGAERIARERFSRTFAAVLAECYGGRWTVKWKGADRPALPPSRDRRTFSGEE